MASPTPAPSRPAKTDGIIPAAWPVQAADTIVDTITKVRDKTTKPALTIARGIVYGLLAAIVGAVALIVFLVLGVRLYANYMPGNVWPIYAFFAILFIAGGLFALKKANAPAPSSS